MRLADIKKLQEKKYRKEHGLYVIQGEKVVDEAIAAGVIVELFCTEEHVGKYKKVLQDVHVGSRAALQEVGTQATTDGIIALARCSYECVSDTDISQLAEISKSELVLALDGVNDPGNLGTIIRTADWFGVHHIVCSQGTVDVYNPKVINATMGSFLRVQVQYGDLPAVLALGKKVGSAVYGADMHGDSLYDAHLNRSGFLVMGSESHGLSAEVSRLLTQRITIPRVGGAESLNVAIATAVILSHMR